MMMGLTKPDATNVIIALGALGFAAGCLSGLVVSIGRTLRT